MHVLHIIVGLNIGGAELMLARLIDGNRQPDQFRHTVVSLTDLGIVGARLQQEGVPVHVLGMTSAASIPTSLWRLRRLIRSLRPDIVQTWMYHADFLGGLAAKLAGHKRVIWGVRTTHVSMEGVRTTVWLRQLCALLSHRVPEHVVCAADASRRAHVAVGYDPSRMVVIPNGFDIATLKAASQARAAQRAAFGLADDAVAIGVVGRFNPVKDFHNFTQAAGRIARQAPETRFVFVGRNLDTANASLMAWIHEAGIADRVTLLGERGDVPACLAALDIFCLSSRSEGFPNVVGEAMGAGVPCVVTDVGDAALLVGDTGTVVPKEDPVAMAEALMALVRQSKESRQASGRRAQARVEAVFSVEAARERFAALYRGQPLNTGVPN